MCTPERQPGPSSEDLGEDGVGPSQVSGKSLQVQVDCLEREEGQADPGDAEHRSRLGTAPSVEGFHSQSCGDLRKEAGRGWPTRPAFQSVAGGAG